MAKNVSYQECVDRARELDTGTTSNHHIILHMCYLEFAVVFESLRAQAKNNNDPLLRNVIEGLKFEFHRTD